MFNDLNQTEQVKPTAPNVPTPPVDDIFADTDKTAEAKKFSGYYSEQAAVSPLSNNPTDVETKKIGLSSFENTSISAKGKILKIALIIILVILLLGLIYLVYNKFLAGKSTVSNLSADTKKNSTTTAAKVSTSSESNKQEFGQDLNKTETATSTVPVSEEEVLVPSVPLATTTPPVAKLIDTDSDGLSDEEELVLGTDINLSDTDSDGLSDYEEVQIYKTNPLKADTDGDTYNDGQEVKTGYNPLGAGKLIDLKKASTTPGI